MGIIDSTSHTLHCSACNLEETKKVLDKGSGWSGSSWQSRATYQNFETQWEGGGKAEPTLLSAKCRRCGVFVKGFRSHVGS